LFYSEVLEITNFGLRAKSEIESGSVDGGGVQSRNLHQLGSSPLSPPEFWAKTQIPSRIPALCRASGPVLFPARAGGPNPEGRVPLGVWQRPWTPCANGRPGEKQSDQGFSPPNPTLIFLIRR